MPNTADQLVAEAFDLVGSAHRLAVATVRADPESTWFDAAAAIRFTESHLSMCASGAEAERDSRVDGEGSCLELLLRAEAALAAIPPGEGPPALALIRAYLTDAIVEVQGHPQ